MQGRLYFVLPWPSPCVSPAGSLERLVPTAAGHPAHSQDEHSPVQPGESSLSAPVTNP